MNAFIRAMGTFTSEISDCCSQRKNLFGFTAASADFLTIVAVWRKKLIADNKWIESATVKQVHDMYEYAKCTIAVDEHNEWTQASGWANGMDFDRSDVEEG